MGEITSKFSREDIDTLIEAMSDWEAVGNDDFYRLIALKGAPSLPEDHEAYEFLENLKAQYKRREKNIMADRATRQEKTIFLKAKLMLVRQDIGINQLFEVATETTPEPAKLENVPVSLVTDINNALKKKLERAEYFIKDLGVWDHFQKFLTETAETEQ